MYKIETRTDFGQTWTYWVNPGQLGAFNRIMSGRGSQVLKVEPVEAKDEVDFDFDWVESVTRDQWNELVDAEEEYLDLDLPFGPHPTLEFMAERV